MINLLPPQEKKELLEEENYRLVLVLGVLILFFLISLALVLFSIKIYISGQVEVQKIIFSEADREFRQSEIQNFQEKINSTNLTFSKLNSFYQEKFYFTETLVRISKTLPVGTYLTNFSFTPLATKELRGQVSLTGFCPNREVLFELKENLENEKDFQEIYFPPENWVKSANIDFGVSFKIKK
ncbi:hypothetical protein ACFL0A_01535 [Patescibacteria group bacterium]